MMTFLNVKVLLRIKTSVNIDATIEQVICQFLGLGTLGIIDEECLTELKFIIKI